LTDKYVDRYKNTGKAVIQANAIENITRNDYGTRTVLV